MCMPYHNISQVWSSQEKKKSVKMMDQGYESSCVGSCSDDSHQDHLSEDDYEPGDIDVQLQFCEESNIIEVVEGLLFLYAIFSKWCFM